MIKFLILIVQAIFFLIIGFLYYYAPESSYFWNDGFGGSVFSVYEDIGEALILLTPGLVLFNILISWLGLIKKINENIVVFIYLEFIGIIAIIPSAFTSFFNEDEPFLLSIALVSTALSFMLSIALGRILNSKIKISLLILFTIIGIASVLFLIIAMLVGAGAA